MSSGTLDILTTPQPLYSQLLTFVSWPRTVLCGGLSPSARGQPGALLPLCVCPLTTTLWLTQIFSPKQSGLPRAGHLVLFCTSISWPVVTCLFLSQCSDSRLGRRPGLAGLGGCSRVVSSFRGCAAEIAEVGNSFQLFITVAILLCGEFPLAHDFTLWVLHSLLDAGLYNLVGSNCSWKPSLWILVSLRGPHGPASV